MVLKPIKKRIILSNLRQNHVQFRVKAEGKDIVHFGFGQSPFPVPDCMVDRLKQFAHVNDYLRYTDPLDYF